ncbi:MAG: hypothetical protein AAF602_13875 [Myxococcota bacterium]
MFALVLLQACANSGLGQPDPIDESCPYVGTWALAGVDCGAIPTFEPFFARYDDAMLEVSAAPAGCSVQVELFNAECRATERWTITLDEEDPGLGELESGGIAACDPDGCSFDGTTPCLPGTGAGASGVSLALSEPELVLTGALGAAAADLECPLGLVGTFTRMP